MSPPSSSRRPYVGDDPNSNTSLGRHRITKGDESRSKAASVRRDRAPRVALGAAEELYVSQPAVSKHLAALESEVGKPLVIRGREGARLTPAGEVLADYVLRAEALLANAQRALLAEDDGDTGTLTLAASGIPGTYLLPELVARFRDSHPGIEFEFDVTTSDGALELVRAHRVELGVVGGFTLPPELESEPLLEDEIVLVGPPTLGGRRLRPKELESMRWLSREEGSATRAAVETARWELGLHSTAEMELQSWEAVKLAVGTAPVSRRSAGLRSTSSSKPLAWLSSTSRGGGWHARSRSSMRAACR